MIYCYRDQFKPSCSLFYHASTSPSLIPHLPSSTLTNAHPNHVLNAQNSLPPEETRSSSLLSKYRSRTRRKSRPYRCMLHLHPCLLYTSPSPRDRTRSRMPSSA